MTDRRNHATSMLRGAGYAAGGQVDAKPNLTAESLANLPTAHDRPDLFDMEDAEQDRQETLDGDVLRNRVYDNRHKNDLIQIEQDKRTPLRSRKGDRR